MAEPGHALAGDHGAPIPAFSRMYGTACSTCHTAAPKLNMLGEAFRLNGYRMPSSQLLHRRDQPVSLGAPEWDEEWPRSIRSSDLPGVAPLALRVVSDAQATRDARVPYGATYRFPAEIHLLAGAPLGEDVSAFVDVGWTPADDLEIHQAKVQLQDVIPGLPPRLVDLGVGLLNPYLLTLADPSGDRAARQRFLWQTFEASEVEVRRTGGGEPIRTGNDLALGHSQASVELSGLVGTRLSYGTGIAQGLGDGGTDRNGRKDFYYRLRYKLGGLDLAGGYDSDRPSPQPVVGQLLDRTLVLEHFGYLGSESTEQAPQGGHTAFGVAARALLGRFDLGVGYVVRSFDRPWIELPTERLRAESVFAKAEYLVFPWLMGSLKAERMDVPVSDLPPTAFLAPPPSESTRMLPGVILLLRQNVRLVAEGELFLRHAETRAVGLSRPHNLWMRLDVAF